MDSQGEQACAVRLGAQLHDRYLDSGDPRRRSDAGAHLQRGGGDQNDDRAHRTTVLSEAQTARRRHCVRDRQVPRLAHRYRHRPDIPVWEMANRNDGTFSRGDFSFDKEKDEYTCPNGKALRRSARVHDGRTILYRASKLDCDLCPLKARYCPNVTWRKISRDVNEETRDIARAHENVGVREIPR